MIGYQKNGLYYFKSPQLEKFSSVWHGIFTRLGGRSSGPYRGLNVSFAVGDSTRNVIRNRELVSACAAADRLVFCRQIHGNQIIEIRKSLVYNLRQHPDQPPVGDAMISDVPGIYLAVTVADCQPVLICDPEKQIIANVHAGWRGSIQNILGSTIQVMKTDYGSRPRDIVALIGPSLGPCCAEFINYRKEIPSQYWPYKNDNDFFDFWAISRDQLQQADVLPGNIHTSGICTRCRTDLFFSYRAGGTTGRFAAVIGLKPNISESG